MLDIDQRVAVALAACENGIGGFTTGRLILDLQSDNRRLRAACEAVLSELERGIDRQAQIGCALELAAALADAVAGGEGT